MVFGKFISGDGDLSVVRRIRQQVYEGEPGIASDGRDLPDAFCIHAVAYAEDVPVGTGRILFDGDRFTIAGIAVLPDYRGQLYGDFLLRLLVDKAMMSNAREVHLDARHGTEGFFEKVGFEACGEEFQRRGTVWLPMVLHTDRIHRCCDCR